MIVRKLGLFTLVATLLTITPLTESACHAQPGQTYPRVIGPSGRPYGPTQAHYQYEKRYGRSWDGTVTGNQGYPIRSQSNYLGNRGSRYYGAGSRYGRPNFYGPAPYFDPRPFGPNIGGYLNSYSGFGVSTLGGLGTNFGVLGSLPYSSFGPGYGYNYNPIVTPGYYDPFSIPGGYIYQAPSTYVAPPVQWGVPGPLINPTIPQFPQANLQLPLGVNSPVLEQDLPKEFNIPDGTLTNRMEKPIVPPSTPEAKLKSIQLQDKGDEQLRKLQFPAASRSYREAMATARDRVDPIYRYGFVLAAQGRYADAVEQFKLASSYDSSWPQYAPSLDSLLSERNRMEKVQLKHRVAEWTEENIRDPERIYLLALMLYLDGDERADGLVDTAILIAGSQPHLVGLKTPRQPLDNFLEEENAGEVPTPANADAPIPAPRVDAVPGDANIPELPPVPE